MNLMALCPQSRKSHNADLLPQEENGSVVFSTIHLSEELNIILTNKLHSMKIKSNNSLEPDISEVISKIKDFGGDKIKFIVLDGSAAKKQNTNLSEIDIAVFHSGDKKERFQFRMKILGRIGNKFDIQIYQDLPLYVQNEILSRGEVLYYRDYKEIFDTFMKTIREFGDFKPRLELYYSNMGV